MPALQPSGKEGFFSKAVQYALKTEAGFVNHKDDAGGPTNFGVTLETLSLFRGYHCTEADVKALTRDEAVMIYYKKYWKATGLHQVASLPVAVAMFDAAVLFGPMPAVLYAQRALVECWRADLKVDGILGPKTLAALNQADSVLFLKAFSATLLSRLIGIIVARPATMVFQNGWEARVKAYPDLALKGV